MEKEEFQTNKIYNKELKQNKQKIKHHPVRHRDWA